MESFSLESIAEIFEKFQIPGGISDEGMGALYGIFVTFAILVLGICIFIAVTDKNSRVFAILAGATNFLSLILTPSQLQQFHNGELVKYFYGSSQDDVNEQILEYYVEQIPLLLLSMLMSLLTMAGLAFMIILICKNFKAKPKLLPIFALVTQLFRYLFIAPYKLFAPLLGGQVTLDGQISQAVVYCFFYLVPFILMGVLAVLNLVKSKKAQA